MAKWSDVCGFWPKQKEATRESDAHQFTLFGGSRGPGKSRWLRWNLARQVLRLRGSGVKDPMVGLFCETYPELEDRQISKIVSEFPRAWGRVRSTLTAGLGFYFRGGGMIALRNLDDPEKYQSAEFAAVGVDELTRNGKDVFDTLRGSLRWPGVPRPRFMAATTPGNIGHLWVKDLWVDGMFPPEMEPLRPEFAFVPALPDDNPSLPPEYWQMLETLPPELSRAWRYGDWDVFEGQVFAEWRRHLHVIEPTEIPDHWPRWRAVDWGYASPMAVLWLARNPDNGRTVVYRELYEAGLTDPEQATRIVGAESDEYDGEIVETGERVEATLADPSMWTKRTIERKAISSADVYATCGVKLTRADNDRIAGVRRVHEALAVQPDGLPNLLIFSNCVNLIRTLPALPRDEHNPEDVDTGAEDHPFDALKYGLSYKVRGPRRPPEPGRDPWARVRRSN